MIKYPAKLKKTKINKKNGFYLEFIDIPNTFTQGYSIEELYEMGQDVLSLMLEDYIGDNIEIPEPSDIQGEDIIYVEPFPEIAIPIMLKKIRKEKKLTQKEISQKLGVSYQTYQKLERGLFVNPTLKTLERLAKVFELKMILDFQRKQGA